MKRAAALIAGLVLLTTGTPARAQDSAAVAVVTQDGMSVFRLAFQIDRTMRDTVSATNAAVAFANCDACEAIAISIQIVLVMSDPTVLTAENLALAFNFECSACTTLANAYQYVLTTGGPVRFTPEAYRELAAIRLELLSLRDADLTLAALRLKIEELETRVAAIIESSLVPAGAPEPTASDTPAPSPTPDATATETPSATPTPTPTESST